MNDEKIIDWGGVADPMTIIWIKIQALGHLEIFPHASGLNLLFYRFRLSFGSFATFELVEWNRRSVLRVLLEIQKVYHHLRFPAR